MPRSLSRAVFFVALLAGALGMAAPAMAVDTPFSVRYAQTLRGSINAVGNQLLTCPAAAANCTNARDRVGTNSTLNNNYNMGYVDVDGDAATVNSSTATLSLPAGATVTWAGLYWGADTAAGTGGSAAPNAANLGTVRFKVDSSSYQTVTATPADVLTSTGKATRYRAFANVTDLLPAAGNAAYTVGDVQTGRGDDRFAGWSLVVAYQDATQAIHRVSVYDGLGTVDATRTFSTNITPFFTPASGTVATKTGLLAFEGDAGIVGETATFNGTPLTDAINGPGNLMNSTMAVDGTLFTAKNPNYGNLMGTDIDVWNNTGLLANHQSSAALAFTSNQDLFVPSALWLVSDEGPAANTAGPTVGGMARDGSTLTANPGSWNGTPTITYEYQWQRCDSGGANCVDIPGQTGSTYTLSPADVGSTVRVLVTAVNDAGSSTPASSPPTTTVTQLPPSNVTLPQLSGTERDGQTLTADDGDWTGTGPLSYSYQWERCDTGGSNCTDIGGATSATYVLTGADIGHAVRVEVTATNVAGNAAASSSPTTAVIADPPSNTAVPSLSGSATEGSTLTLDTGTWTGTSPLAYDVVWQRCDAAGANCQAIPGETGSTYTLTTADLDATIRALVTASNTAGVAAVASAPTVAVAMDPPANTVVPVVSGDRVDGETLTAGEGTWSGTQPLLYTYQWQRCDEIGNNCANVAGATNPAFTLTGAAIGQVVRVLVTAANDAGSAAAASVITSPVAAAPPVNVTVPTTTGTTRAGQVLTAQDGTWTGSAPMMATYRWERCDTGGANCVDIPGATAGTYTLEDADAGHTARVSVTYTNAAGNDTGRSAPTAVVAGNPPANTVAPLLTGTARDGETLTLDDGEWTGTPTITYAYQWQRCDADATNCVDIAGATGLTYDLQSADLGGTVRAVVTATNADGDDAAATGPSAVVIAAPPAVTIAPAVVGTALDGETVTADPGIWSGTAPVTYDYQWLRCDLDGTDCVEIPGATDDEYTLTSADADHGIRVEVTATNAAGSVTEVSPVAAVDAAAPQNTTVPTVSGTYADGQTLTAGDGGWSGTNPLTFEYQWLRCEADGTNCQLIPGATGGTYTLTSDDVGHQVVVSVEATNSGGSAQAASAPPAVPVAADPPQSTTPPVVTGVLEDGATLAAGSGGWTGTEPLTFEYQWQRCEADGTACADIPGATGSTYTLTADDIAGTVRVVVAASNDAGDDSSTSAPTATIAPSAPVSTTPPAVTGSPVDGQTLIADPGSFSGTGPLTYAYQWQRCEADGTACADIPGATGSTYDLVSADVGGAVVVMVTATNDADSATASSPATGEVQPLAPANVAAPTISGDPLDGHTLTADPGTWTGTTPLTYAYQWQRCDTAGANCTDILGADDPTYTLAPGDIGHVLTVVVTATNAGGSVPSAAAPTATAEADPPANSVAPAVSGTPEDGETLTADPGTWTGTAPVAYTYQWQRCDADGTDCADILGATGSTYDLTPADVDHAIVVAVTASNAGGEHAATSAPGSSVAVDPPASTGTPEATGTPADGQTLTADPGTWTGTGPIDFSYQWQRCDAGGANCVDITGATDPTYTLGTDDLGSTVRVVVTGDNGEQTEVPSTAVGPIAALPPASTSVPTVSGTVADGHTLTAGDGGWDGSLPLTFTYQWQRCDVAGSGCVDVPGAEDPTYDLTDADVGHTIRVEVTAANSAGDDSAVSAPTAATLPAPPVNTTQPPAPTGTGVDGGTLTAAPGAWTGDGTITYTYQWQRCDADGTGCVDIDDATGETYSPAPGDVGHAIVVEVTATNPGGSSTEASAPTAAPIAAAPPVNSVPPSVTGDPADGVTLTADPGTWTGTPTIDYEYQWQRCDADGANCEDLDGETGETYTPGPGDIGHTITVVVTATNAGGEATESAAEITGLVVASPPQDTVAPDVTGDDDLGETLTAGTGTWTGTLPVTYEYQWQRCDEDGENCVDVDGATDETYTLTEADQSHTVVVVVTATNDAGSDTSTSAPSAVLPAPPANTVAPAISGDEEIRETLTADPGTWTGTGPLTYEYQWQRCDFFGENCVDITGATDDTYTLDDDDAGHVITVVVTASNAAGTAAADAPATAAVVDPTPTPTPTATPTPTPTATPTPRPRPATAAAQPTLPAAPGGADALLGDLGSVPGSLVSDTSCQQLAGNAKYRRLEVRGIGRVRVRAYTRGPATKLMPIRVSTTIRRAKTKKIKVRYTVDGRALRAGGKPRFKAAITPALLQRIGFHTLTATVTGKAKRKVSKRIVLRLKTVSCRTLFTAQRWRTTLGAGLRLRIDARTALDRIAFTVPAGLLPRQTARRRTVGFMRVFVAGQPKRKRYALKLARRGRARTLLSGPGRPVVRMVRGGLAVSGMPARSAIAELTIYRMTKRDGTTRRKRYRVKARITRPGAAALSLSVRPRAPR
jgi:hypothetical protein